VSLLAACEGGNAGVTLPPLASVEPSLPPHSDLSPQFSPDGAWIVFSSNRDGNDEIYAIRVDGTDLTRLTSDPGADLDPSYSPDGSRIEFDSDRFGPPAIFVMRADGSNPINVSRPTTEGHIFPAWSPDGATIAFACGADFDRLDLCEMDARGFDVHVLLPSRGGRTWEAAWSPDGTRLLFVSNETGDDEIYQASIDGKARLRFTTNPGRDADPAWAPDGSLIVFDGDRGGRSGLFLMEPGGGHVRLLIEGSYADPSWSPDGTTIACYRAEGDEDRLSLVDVETGEAIALT
jgi:TolB protein